MNGDSDDDEIVLTRVDSAPRQHENVPQDQVYNIKVVHGVKPTERFQYCLKAGRLLPYVTEIQGMDKYTENYNIII